MVGDDFYRIQSASCSQINSELFSYSYGHPPFSCQILLFLSFPNLLTSFPRNLHVQCEFRNLENAKRILNGSLLVLLNPFLSLFTSKCWAKSPNCAFLETFLTDSLCWKCNCNISNENILSHVSCPPDLLTYFSMIF